MVKIQRLFIITVFDFVYEGGSGNPRKNDEFERCYPSWSTKFSQETWFLVLSRIPNPAFSITHQNWRKVKPFNGYIIEHIVNLELRKEWWNDVDHKNQFFGI